MSDAGTGEALKMGMTQAGKQSGLPFGQIMGSLSGAALQAIYNNRKQVDITAMGRYAQRSQRSSDESTSSTPLSIRQSHTADATVQRPSGTSAADGEMPHSIGGLGAAERLERVRKRTESATERATNDPCSAKHWHRGAPTSLQRAAATRDTNSAGETQVPDSVRDVISSPGRSLDPSVQRVMEDRMGDSLGDVRIHTRPKAAQACEQINARAFTVGNHVAFNSGEYDPESPAGQHVLAHELAHVRQQTGGAVSMLPQEDLGLEIDPDPQLEREAEETAQRVIQGGKLGIQRMAKTEVHLQRYPGKSFVQKGKDVLGNDPAPVMTDVQGKGQIAAKVEALAENQQKLFTEVKNTGQSTAEKVGAETGKGTLAATGGLVGTALMGPGVGTLVGGFAGGAVGGIYERLFDDGTQAMTSAAESASDLLTVIDQRVKDALERYHDDVETGSETVVGEGGNV
ncbi:DUF4157 domain-containing protein [Natribaculum luteum]|uniref:DUF4157 domain-containing protein n=1 Tax=Natribaculum luteum TaxID=1586232 RepID=A0ABD5P0H7_9EURY